MPNSVESLLEQARAQQTKAAQENRDLSLKSIGQNYTAGIENVNKAAEEAQRQNYITKEMAQRNIGQQLAAAGLNGGAAETTILGLANKYGENRRMVDADRMNNVAALEAEKAQREAAAQTEYNGLVSQIESNYATQLASAKEAEAQRALQREMAEADRAFQREMAAQSAARASATAVQPSAQNQWAYLGLTDDKATGFAEDLNKARTGVMSKSWAMRNFALLEQAYGPAAAQMLVDNAHDPTQEQVNTQNLIANALAQQAQQQAQMNANPVKRNLVSVR